MLKIIAALFALSLVFAFLSPSSLQAAPPSNDNIASAKLIDLPYNETTLNIEQATVEAGEPQHSCSPAGASTGLNTVWFQFTLVEQGTIRAGVDSTGSSYPPNNDTLMSIYDDVLQEVACNDDASSQSLFSYLQIDLPPGTYRLKVSNDSAIGLQSASTLLLNVTFTPGVYPTATATLIPTTTPDVGATSTALALTAAVTPTLPATPTPQELIVNGGFEVNNDTDAVPDGWTEKVLSSDKRLCNKTGKVVAYTGACSFQFKGSAGEQSQLKQELSGVQAGDTLTLTAAIDTTYGTSGKVVYVKLAYAQGKDQIKIELAAPTAGYEVFSQSLTVNGTPTKASVGIRFRGLSGKVRVDAVSLTRSSLRLSE